ncbi:phage/plasmid replication protein, II/X family [Acinetobacter sp. WCHAc010052]|uniref:phage/plasmid replication protein, II/X family n=1 Tax=Acinetobacter sp. WCHAc010052 TaxID=2004647 RepID=UPI000B3BE3E6|nr:phage/plasmid replication protein, II/X family [Acinetobacter sp. WCHAc010052]AXY61113.1 phage replication protein [Acinetobacter sp. WCHAc010052]
MKYIRNTLEIDWVNFDICIDHDVSKISDGCIIDTNFNIDDLSNGDLNLGSAKIRNKSKIILSKKGDPIKLTSKKNIVNVQGNIFKWLHGQNVTGESNLLKIICNFVEKLENLGFFYPTKAQMFKIKKGNFRVYRVDIKQDLIFYSKDEALRYLDHVIKLGTYPYKKKDKYKNGCYFGMTSKRWNIRYYHKGTELRDKNRRFYTEKELFALAELMVRSEIRVLNPQLKDWCLSYGYHWGNLEKINLIFLEKFNELKLPDVMEREKILNIDDKSDRKFYAVIKNNCPEDFYCRATISSKKTKFLNEYGIDIDDLRAK